MADQKLSQLTFITTPTGVDRLYIVDDPNGTPVSKALTLDTLFGTISSNVSANGTTILSGNVTLGSTGKYVSVDSPYIKVNKATVSSNNTTTQINSTGAGSIFWDENYLYVATSNTTIKRVALSAFSS